MRAARLIWRWLRSVYLRMRIVSALDDLKQQQHLMAAAQEHGVRQMEITRRCIEHWLNELADLHDLPRPYTTTEHT